MFIDVHCHLDMLEKEGVSLNDAILRCRKSKVGLIVVNGVTPRHNRTILAMAVQYPEVKAALGMYPIDALSLSEHEIDEEISFLRRRKDDFIAIGEIGLDLKEDELLDGFERQKKVFSKFVSLAIELDKPVIVHSRKAELETIELLDTLGAKKVVMHCFSGKMKLAERIAKNGWCLSIPANCKYSQQFQDVIKKVSIDNLLCETDSPYLHPDKEWPNEPANVIESYKKIAEIKGLSLAETSVKIASNYSRLFDG